MFKKLLRGGTLSPVVSTALVSAVLRIMLSMSEEDEGGYYPSAETSSY